MSKEVKVTKESIKIHNDIDKKCFTFTFCSFASLNSQKGGAIFSRKSNISLKSCSFFKCSAEFAGTIYSSQSLSLKISKCSIKESKAERFGSIINEGNKNDSPFIIQQTNFSSCTSTEYVSCIRYEKSKISVEESLFESCESKKFGVLWDWTSKPTVSTISLTSFVNNSSGSEGSVFTGFHWMHMSLFDKCVFQGNKGKCPTSIFVYSTEANVNLISCLFSGERRKEIGTRFNDSIIKEENCKFNQASNDFNQILLSSL